MLSGDGSGALKWQRLGRRELLDCPIFRVVERENLSQDGRRGRFTLLESADWATVVPVVEGAEGTSFLMVRQYRHGSDEISVEFPGGVVEPGEEPVAAAARELLEETGYRAATIRAAGTMSPNPAFMTNRFHVFLAEGLASSGSRQLDEHEIVDCLLVSADELHAAMGTGQYSHALMVAALFMAERLRGGSPH